VLNSRIKNIQFSKAKRAAHTCGSITASKHKEGRTTLRLNYHGCENLAPMS